MKRLAIIPARSGSKGLKDKNIIPINGIPMIGYTIQAAKKSEMFDKIIVSTDSLEYKKISEEFGAEVIIRPPELSSDTASTYVVVKDVLEKQDSIYDYFALLQPTSPMRNDVHIVEANSLFESKIGKFDFLVSVAESEHAKILVNEIDADSGMSHFDEDFSNYTRQNYKYYSPNGAIFIAKPFAYLEQKHFFGKRSLAFIMNKEDSVDVDGYVDYLLACILMSENFSNKNRK